jgi:hypothetical protein
MPLARTLGIVLPLCFAVSATRATAADIDFSGAWEVRNTVTLLGRSALGPQKEWTDHRTVEISQDPASGHVTMNQPQLTPEMVALGYQAWNPGFDGSLRGDVAVGTGAYWKVPFWTKDSNVNCPRPAGLRFSGDLRIEFISAVPLDKTCQWTFTDFANLGAVQHVVSTLTPVYIVRDVHFIDQPKDGSPPKPIDTAAPDQEFRIVVDFKVSPPAPVYVTFRRRPFIIRATQTRDIFQSDPMTIQSSGR